MKKIINSKKEYCKKQFAVLVNFVNKIKSKAISKKSSVSEAITYNFNNKVYIYMTADQKYISIYFKEYEYPKYTFGIYDSYATFFVSENLFDIPVISTYFNNTKYYKDIGNYLNFKDYINLFITNIEQKINNLK